MPNYASEYSPSNIASLTKSFGELLDPQAEDARRRLAQSLAGTPGMFGSARAGGIGQIEASRLGQIGQYGQKLSEAGLEAGRGERLTAEERAYQESPTSQFSRQLTQQGAQFGQTMGFQEKQLAQQKELQTRAYELQAQGMSLDEAFRRAQLEQQGSQFGQTLGEQQAQRAQQESQFGRQLGQQGSQFGQTLTEQQAQRGQQAGQFGQTFGEQQRQYNIGQFGNVGGTGESFQAQQIRDALANSLMNRQWLPTQYTGMTPTGEKSQALKEWETQQTGMFGGQKTLATQLAEAGLTGQYGGQNTMNYINSILPYVQSGNLPSSALGGQYAGFQSAQQLDPSYQFFQRPEMKGYDPYYLSLLAQTDPEKLKKILAGYTP